MKHERSNISAPPEFKLWERPLTFLDSKTQKLVPSSSTWFQNLNPTSVLPDTFLTVQKSKASKTTTSTVCGRCDEERLVRVFGEGEGAAYREDVGATEEATEEVGSDG